MGRLAEKLERENSQRRSRSIDGLSRKPCSIVWADLHYQPSGAFNHRLPIIQCERANDSV
jgi:hypothetical protein